MTDSNNIQPMAPGEEKSIDSQNDVSTQLAAFEKFVARRFDEISMEINATSQLLDMAEDDAEKRFNNMLGALSAITELGDGNTSANSGAELEAAVLEAEKAANTILDASDKIGLIIQDKFADLEDLETQTALNEIDAHLQDILIACSFQDLVGQRIRTAMAQLRGVETELSETLSHLGLTAPVSDNETKENKPETKTTTETNASQDDIDALFS